LIVDAFYVINKDRHEKYNGKYEKIKCINDYDFCLVTPIVWFISGITLVLLH
jgi:hypothetical protein